MAEIQQVDVARLAWVDMNNGTETIFKPTDCNISRNTETQLPYSDFSIHVLYDSVTVDRYATDSGPIFHLQSSNIPPTFGTPCIYWLSVDWCIGQHIGRSTRGRVSADISTCQLIRQSKVDRFSADTSTDISADIANWYSTKGCTNCTRFLSCSPSHTDKLLKGKIEKHWTLKADINHKWFWPF